MRQLHVIGFSSEGVILAGTRGAKTGSYLLVLDAETLEQLDAARRTEADVGSAERPTRASASRAESALSPRQIQARLRAGRSIAQVASEAGVSTDWVERFAAPVLAEQAAAVTRAGEAILSTARRGRSDRPLLQSLLRNLAGRGVRLTDAELDAGWSAHQLLGGEWFVSFRFRSRGKEQQAEWVYDGAAGTLTAANRLGTELGYVGTTPPKRGQNKAGANPIAPHPAPHGTPARKKAASNKPVAKKAIPRHPAASPAAQTKAASNPAMPTNPPPRAPSPRSQAPRSASPAGTSTSAQPGRRSANGSRAAQNGHVPTPSAR